MFVQVWQSKLVRFKFHCVMVSIEIEFEMKFQKPFYMDFAKLMKFDTVTEYHILYVWYIRSVVK